MKRLDEGGLTDLGEWILDYDPAVAFIDTLACVKPVSRRDGGSYEADYAALALLQSLANLVFASSLSIIREK